MGGLECITVVDVDGMHAYVVGHFNAETPSGEFECYDIYIRNERSNVYELVDLGQPFVKMPTDDEVAVVIKEIFNPTAVRVLANA